MQQRFQQFALIDGAASPAEVVPLLERSGAAFVSLYEGLPEERLGPASLFLARIDDPEATWVDELNKIDLHFPCLTLMWSHVDCHDLATHLRAFLIAGIGDGMTAMVRFFDPRNTGAVLELWGEHIRNLFLAPIAQLSYRGRHDEWQTLQNRDAVSREPGRISRSVVIELAQSDIDRFMAHSEPDELMASLIDLGHIDHTLPYRKRFLDFEPRYGRALSWGFAEPRDRLAYCDCSYRYGADFDRHPRVRDALTSCRQTGGSFDAAVDRIPGSVWNELKRQCAEALCAQP